MSLQPTTPHAQEFPHSFATLLDRQYQRADFLQGLKALIVTAQERIRQEHATGARGRNVVRHFTALVDDVVRTISQYTAQLTPPGDEPYALLALGGYGRGELNPFSDIDLMFLCQRTPPDQLIRDTLYLLWDVGYTLGYSVRTRQEAVKMVDADLTAQTATLEARFLDGDAEFFQRFHEEICHRHFTQRRRRAFIRQKIAEYQRRHATFTNTVNLMEPNVKESPGGLRDYHTALWVGMACYQANTLEVLVDHSLLTPSDCEAIETALDFLFRVRNALHYHYGRKNDLLSVDVQERLAEALGFTPSENKLAVEHFLKAYYVQANVIYNFCASMIHMVTRSSQTPLRRLWRRRQRLGDGFLLVDGYLNHDAPDLAEVFSHRPVLLMQAFIKASQHHVPLDPTLSRTIKMQAPLLAAEAVRHDPETTAFFFQALAQPQVAPMLRAMHRHGLLGMYIPEFEALTCLVQHDLYHRYTVDEHTFMSIEILEKLADTSEPSLQPLARLYQQTADKSLLKFALLLHDLGKDVGPGRASHVHRSGELSALVCERMGLLPEQRHTLQILVVNHLLMNQLAQRRDITDKKVIAELAGVVETVTNLEQLYLLTFADTSAVGPDVWTVWKGTLLAELYRRTLEYLAYQTPATGPSEAELRKRLRPAIVQALPPTSDTIRVDHFLDTMPTRYLVATPPEQIAKHVHLTQPELRTPLVVDADHHFSLGYSSVTICVPERRGVFSMIAGALSHNKLNILGAQIYTSTDGIAIDTLQVETTAKTPVTDQRVWHQVETDLQAALAGERHFDAHLTQRRYFVQERKLQAFAKPPNVVIDNTSSDSHTILEVQAQDQLGLLYKLTRLLYEQGLDIALAKISTEANRAIDVFYVTDARSHKITADATVENLRQVLLAMLD